ncbi:tubby C-terminal domain-like protein [Kurthia sibirica]|uniref:Tubby C-terminal domain-containing protein n=1 Tax=Kurthia sibirica TaxID=202750 RepID=A0A2U3AI51_9BACL|nr:hypothetical protein [Kurthia sibirica]PWI24131.1 hypothetical protein DEX24_15195 [Kurthia sibirica]GEK35712.1 hypothetical protein KSI01_32450 [Kurthia sibirica]
MKKYRYDFKKEDSFDDEILMLNEEGHVLYELVKNKHNLGTAIIHHTIRGGLKFTYKILDISGQIIWSLNCLFTGFCYKLSSNKMNYEVIQKRVQLLEKKQLFTIANQKYEFELTSKKEGRLTCNGELIATAFDSNALQRKNQQFEIVIFATEDKMAALMAVFFQSFYIER